MPDHRHSFFRSLRGENSWHKGAWGRRNQLTSLSLLHFPINTLSRERVFDETRSPPWPYFWTWKLPVHLSRELHGYVWFFRFSHDCHCRCLVTLPVPNGDGGEQSSVSFARPRFPARVGRMQHRALWTWEESPSPFAVTALSCRKRRCGCVEEERGLQRGGEGLWSKKGKDTPPPVWPSVGQRDNERHCLSSPQPIHDLPTLRRLHICCRLFHALACRSVSSRGREISISTIPPSLG